MQEVGTDEFVIVMNALQQKMESIRKLTQTLLRYPNVQARYYLHRFCYNSKVNYWLRAQFPMHVAPFVEDFKQLQARLIASYHGVNDVNDFNSDQAHMMALYERAALPTEKEGMALSNVAFISLIAFANSFHERASGCK